MTCLNNDNDVKLNDIFEFVGLNLGSLGEQNQESELRDKVGGYKNEYIELLKRVDTQSTITVFNVYSTEKNENNLCLQYRWIFCCRFDLIFQRV